MSEYLIAVIQGIVEGITEFLPVSSTGHLILTGHLMSFSDERADTFEIFIQLGAILAVAWLYRRRIIDMVRPDAARPPGPRLSVAHIALAMLPAVVMGLLLHHTIKTYLFSPGTVLIGLVAGGFFLILAEARPLPVAAAALDAITYRQALGIGLWQCLSLWPGFSRAGATIAGGMLLGADRRTSAEFSFLLAVPMMAAATGLDLFKSRKLLSASDIGPFAVGFVVSFLVAWVAVVGFLRLLERVKLTPFAIYRFALATVFAMYLLRSGS